VSSPFDYDVYLSYSHKDKPTIRKLADKLTSDGIRVWLDEDVIQTGDSIPLAIKKGLAKSRVLVICWSKNYADSEWAQFETNTFQFRDPNDRERRFVPLRLDKQEMSESLRQLLSIDYRRRGKKEYERLRTHCRAPKAAAALAVGTKSGKVVSFKAQAFSLGHTGAVRCVAWSPDGQQALSASLDNTLRLWEAQTGKCLCVLEGHTDRVYAVDWSQDGVHAFSGSEDQTVRSWDTRTARCVHVFHGHTDRVWSVALSPDGNYVLSGSEDETVRLWDARTGQCLRLMEGHFASVRHVAWSSDSFRAISSSEDKTLRLWDIRAGKCLRVMEGHTASVLCVAWSPDGLQALSGSEDRTVRLWDSRSGQCLRILKGHMANVNSVAWSPDGQKVLSGSYGNAVRLWDAQTGERLSVFEGHTRSVQTVAWSPDGRQALSGSADNTVRVWDARTGRCMRLLQGHTNTVSSVVWSADGRNALSGSDDKTVRLWDARTGDCLRVLEGHTESVNSVAWSPDCQQALSGSLDTLVRLWDTRTGQCLRLLKGHEEGVWTVAWSPNGQQALSGSDDVTVRLWDARTGRCLRVMEGHSRLVQSVAWSGNGRQALSASADNTVRLWDAMTGRCLRVLEGHTSRVSSVTWSPNGLQALSGAGDNTVRLWDTRTGQCLRVLEGHTAGVKRVAWSPDGLQAMSGSEDNTVRVWDVRTGQCSRVLEGHTAGVLSVAWSSDGQQAFSAASNGVWRRWYLTEVPNVATEYVSYANAKVLMVGDSGVGKTGLTNYLVHGIKVGIDKPLPSSDGAWASHWVLPHAAENREAQREILLWDFAGQVDYRLVHQLFMDDAAAAVLVFNPQNENPFEGLGQWERDLVKATRKPFVKLLAAGRVDRGGLVVSSASMKRFMAERGFRGALYQTSAKTGVGCEKLRDAIVAAIEWNNIPETASPAFYHRMKKEILQLRDSGLVLIRLSELKQRLAMTLPANSFKLEELETVIGLLSGPGLIQRLDFGGFILLRPEVLSHYAAAVVRSVRQHPQELGCIHENLLLAADLDYQDLERLPREDEAVVLRALLDKFVSRAWCLRQSHENTVLLTFPSYFRRARPTQPGHPEVLLTYRFDGPADEIYATLVVLLHHTHAFHSTELWKSAADFKTQTDDGLGFELVREAEGKSRLEVYFAADVEVSSRVLFLRYIHEHLKQHAQNVIRLRHYSCQNKKCDSHGQRFRDQAMIDKAIDAGKEKVFCPDCGKPISLNDTIEEKFDKPAVKEETRKLQVAALEKIDNESRELQAVHHTGSVVVEALQIYRGYTNSDHGIDGEIEFKDKEGRASGKRLYVQLKSGDSYLKTRQRDGAEIFQIKKERWAEYWQQQAYPVMLVIRTSDGRLRWMDVSAYLKREAQRGAQPVRQIVFEGEELTVMSVLRLREKALGSEV
jgi:WD40 repeat protein